MRIYYSDLLFNFLQKKYPHFLLNEIPGGIKIVDWAYKDDEAFIGFFNQENELIDWYIDKNNA